MTNDQFAPDKPHGCGGGDESGSQPVCGLVPDLMDRSRIAAACPNVRFVHAPADCVHAAVVVVDLARRGDAVAPIREVARDCRIVAFAPHEDADAAARARADGADLVVARSRFFRDVAAAIYTSGQG